MSKIMTFFFVVLTALFLFSSVSTSQNLIPLQKANAKVKNFDDMRTSINKRWEDLNIKNGYINKNGVEQKVPNWKLFKRWEWYWEQRVDVNTGEFPNTNAAFEYAKVKNSLKKSESFNENWFNLGTSSSTGGYAGIGRINCIAFHPTDANTFWVGSPSGGIWNTTDGGSTWTILNNNETVLGVSSIAVNSDYTTSQTLYIATGDRDGGSMWSLSGGQAADNVSVGVYKSTDGGATWTPTSLVYSKSTGSRIFRLLIHPSNNNILLASTTDGIYKTSDGGANWTKTSITSSRFRDMEFNPGDPSIIYAGRVPGSATYVYKSTDTGDSWTAKTISGVVTHYGSQIELAVSANDPSIVYVLLQDGKIYKSTDSGESYSKVSTNDSQNMMGYYTDGSGSASQASYDLCIAANPGNANEVYIGSITTWKSTDGGQNWTALTNWTSYSGYNKSGVPVVHADKHDLVFNGSTLFEGNDGGIYKTINGGSNWTDLTNGMAISQIYRIGVSQTNSVKTITGLQDNGSKLYSGSWSDVTGGDGMECIVDYSDANYMYSTYVEGKIYRTLDNWASYTVISDNIPSGKPNGAWVTPYVIHPTTPGTLFAGYDQVWKTTDRGDNWTNASSGLSSTNLLRSLAISPSNGDILYAADQIKMWKTTNGGGTWTEISANLPSLSNSITYIAVHATDPDIVWFTVGGYTSAQKVFESTNGGSSWTEIGAGLPNLPVMCIVHYKEITDRNVLFVGTDLGVYVKDGANNWAEYNTGLPSVVVTELDIYYNPSGTDKLRAGTYGRGLWETNIDAALPVELTTFTANSNNEKVSLEWVTATEVNNFGFEVERAVDIELNDNLVWSKIGFVQGAGNSNSSKYYNFADRITDGGNKFQYRLKQIDINGQFEYSDVVEVEISPEQFILSENYPNPFNPTTNISFTLPQRAEISLKVYDVLGKEVKNLVNEIRNAGVYSVTFDASELPSGVYYYTLKANKFAQTKKMLLVK